MSERFIRTTLLATALLSIVSLAVITFFIFQAGLPLIAKVGLWSFISGSTWAPDSKPAMFGILPMIIGSIYLTVGALIVGVPLGVAVAVFMAELAPPRAAFVMRPAVQLLAGIPSVIYGFVGLTLLAPVVRIYFGGPGLSVLTSALVLGIMIMPNVISISEDAIRAVPQSYRDGALALGANQWQMIWRVVLPAARSGVIASVILGMGRALGETMAVIMMIGNALRLPTSLVDPATTLTSNIGLELAYASGDHRQALFATGVVLFVFIMGLNFVARSFTRQRVVGKARA